MLSTVRLPFHSVSFAVQRLFDVVLLVYFYLSFAACAFIIISIKSLPKPMSWNFVPMFSSRSFTVSGLMGGFISGFLLCSVYLYVYVLACSVLTLRDFMDYSLPGSSVLGLFQARLLEWLAISSSRDLSVCLHGVLLITEITHLAEYLLKSAVYTFP